MLETVAAAAESAAEGHARPRAAHDPVGRALEAARDARLERAVLAPPPPGAFGGAPEFGGDFLFDASWVERATGGAVGSSDAFSEETSAWGAPAGPLAAPGRAAAAALRAAGRSASRAAAQLAAVSAAVDLLAAAAGGPVGDASRDAFLFVDAALDDLAVVGPSVGAKHKRGAREPAGLLGAWPKA